MQLSEKTERLISRYLNGYCREEEEKELLKWISQSEENKKHFLKLKDTWDASLKKEDTTETNLFNFYQAQINQKESLQKSIRLWRFVAGIAAILVIGLVISVLVYTPVSREKKLITHTVPLGSKSQVFLADGTEVHLNSGSRLEYYSDFEDGNREVYLSGEAYFQVKTDKSHPFIVNTSDFDITVTGTRFNVCSYDDNPFSSVSLIEGQIGLSASNIRPLALKPGEKIKYNREDRELAYVSLDPQAEIAWKEGLFIFKNIPFPALIKRLERWYDVKLNCTSDKLNTFQYSGSFKNQETIWQVLDALKLTSPIDYSRESFRKFTIKYKPME